MSGSENGTGGIEREPGGTATAVAAARQRAGNGPVGVVEGVADRASALDAFGAALGFPDSYGRNLDALEDCLRDLSWLPAGPVELVWEDGPLRAADPRTHQVLSEILADAVGFTAGSDRPLRVTLAG